MAHLAADFAREHFGFAAGTGAADPSPCRGAFEHVVPLLHEVLDLVRAQDPGPGLRRHGSAPLRHEDFVSRAQQVGGHGVQVDQAGGRRARTSTVPAAVQVAHGRALVDHAGSEEFVVAHGRARGGLLLGAPTVHTEAQKVHGARQRVRVQVSRVQSGQAESVSRLVAELQQRDHAVNGGRARVGLSRGGGLEPGRQRYRPGLGGSGHNPLDGEGEGLGTAGGQGGGSDPRWAARRTVHQLQEGSVPLLRRDTPSGAPLIDAALLAR